MMGRKSISLTDLIDLQIPHSGKFKSGIKEPSCAARHIVL